MRLKLERIFKGDNYTIGKLYIDGVYFCDTLEDKVRELNDISDKVYGKTAIPEGLFDVILSYSPSFRRVLPELLNVPYFKYIRIHSGNKAEDSNGCILVGENKVKGKVINSRITENKLMDILEDNQTNLKIEIV
jgi:hypothetical protein